MSVLDDEPYGLTNEDQWPEYWDEGVYEDNYDEEYEAFLAEDYAQALAEGKYLDWLDNHPGTVYGVDFPDEPEEA